MIFIRILIYINNNRCKVTLLKGKKFENYTNIIIIISKRVFIFYLYENSYSDSPADFIDIHSKLMQFLMYSLHPRKSRCGHPPKSIRHTLMLIDEMVEILQNRKYTYFSRK